MIDSVAVPNSSRVDRVDHLVHPLEGTHIWVHPRRLRVTDLLDDETNELVAEARTNVFRKIFDPWMDLRPIHNSWEGKRWE
jgi:hypothetical protein